jgi:hypothetical protein
MDLAVIGLIVSGIAALSGLSAWAIFWMKRGSAERQADHALEKAKEANDRYDHLLELFSDHRVMTARDIAVIKTLSESNTTALSLAETRLAKSLDGVTDRLDKFNERVDRLLETRVLEGRG